jgi:hypothetical protein
MVLYICELCNKEFNKKYNYTMHINRKKICISDSQIIETILKLKEDNINLNNKIFLLEKETSILLSNKIIELEQKNIILESENKTLTNLVSKCLENNKIIKNNNTTNNNNNTTNNTINNINVKLVPFGMENLDDLTLEEKTNILNSGLLCSVVCTKKINCNPRLPQYHNISFTNLRSNDAKIYDKDKTWRTVDKEDLFESVILRRIDDVNNIIENEEIKISPYMDTLVKKGIDEDEVVKNTKIKKRFHRTVYDFDKNKDKKKLI